MKIFFASAKINSVKNFSASNVNLVGKHFFHVCSILNSSTASTPFIGINTSSGVSNVDNVINNSTNTINLNDIIAASSRISDLQLVPYTNVSKESQESDISLSSYTEAFPWLLDENGKALDYNKRVGLFDGIKVMSNYINTRYNVNPNLISESKLSEILKPFESQPNATMLDLFNHVSKIYNTDNTSLLKVVEEFSNSNITSYPTNVGNVIGGVTSKPLGVYGDVTLNEMFVYLRDLKWKIALERTEVVVNAAPAVTNFVSFSLILRAFMKYVYNRPYDPSISKAIQVNLRRTELGGFLFIGAPLLLFVMNKSALSLKDMIMIHTTLNRPADINIDQNIFNNFNNEGGLFMLISNLNKKIPNTLKFILRLLLFLLVALKLLGFNNIFELFLNLNYIKMYFYITISFYILYHLLLLYLLHRFSQKTISISPVFPAFIMTWLEDIKEASSSNITIMTFKKMCYVQIGLYSSFLVLIIFFF